MSVRLSRVLIGWWVGSLLTSVVAVAAYLGAWQVGVGFGVLVVVALCIVWVVDLAMIRPRVRQVGPQEPEPGEHATLDQKLQALRGLRRQEAERDWERWTEDGVDLVFHRVGTGFADWVRGRAQVRVRVRSRGVEVDGTWFESVDLRSVDLVHGRLVLSEERGTWSSPPLVVPEPSHVLELLQQALVPEGERRAEAEAAAEARRALKRVRPGWSSEEPR